ncbi:hypothetical protein DFP72DRAFT_1152408 [Ephemerocybe angulata]|uniref:DUF6589 domain-containing protein n=1 Tax=Ephemerocybe angulata TaxID=980116 RepID=A0A8H6HIE0_9AGAR|nr:hypothetical protein DFP72DRAFT_1152408 [Tulosesus angulatus]
MEYTLAGMTFDDDFSEADALSSPTRASSEAPELATPTKEDFKSLLDPTHDLPDEDEEDEDFFTRSKRQPAMSSDQKTLGTLEHLKKYSRFSLREFIKTLFTSSDESIRHSAGMFMAENAHLDLMDAWWDRGGGLNNPELVDWVFKKASAAIEREASHLTNRASAGPHTEAANSLRLPAAKVDVGTVRGFKLSELLSTYDRVTPLFQRVMRAFIESPSGTDSDRNRDFGRTMVTSMALNLRSARTNYHQAINSLIFWDNRIPKRIVQMLNQYGFCSSYSYQIEAVASLSRSSADLARVAANDPSKIKMLPYDNFNWVSRAWETSSTHKSQTHDQVSALLVILPTPPETQAKEVTSIAQFKEKNGARHRIDPRQALTDILPSRDDQNSFRQNAIIHFMNALVDMAEELSPLRRTIPKFQEANSIKPIRTEEHYLPTFDQEQGSTRGNMIVLEHYFSKVLKIPKPVFEDTMFTILGDRLTVARDRAAQDQRAIDTSPHAFDHLSSFCMVGGLMHYEMNFVSALAGNSWGSNGASDPVSLSVLQKLLPNHGDINPTKINYYAWLRFLDSVFRALVLKAAMVASNTTSIEGLVAHLRSSPDSLSTVATKTVDQFVIPSPDRLEHAGVKSLKGETQNGHAVLLLHDIMTLREMHDSVKRGHPTRVLRMIKYWMPMFYAAGSFNYSNECMEILHNMVHDWPSPYSDVAFKGMFFNPRGRIEDFKPTDIRVEHLNDRVKERAHGSNASPSVLEKVVPAMGHLQDLTDRTFDEMGVEELNQRHAHVSRQTDIRILLQHFDTHKVFEFSEDKPSLHTAAGIASTLNATN